MASEPIDCSRSPFVSVLCADGCGEYVVATPTQSQSALCTQCRARRIDFDAGRTVHAWPDRYRSEFNPPPPPAIYEIGKNLTPFADTDPSMEFACLTCRERWPMVAGLDPLGQVRAFAGHDRVVHEDDVWLVGGPGGLRERVCDPCGGQDREKKNLEGGPDHTKCQKGRSGGWGSRCDCRHHSKEEIDRIVGRNRPGWKPLRWSDPLAVRVATENIENRWNQLNLFDEDPE